MASLENSEMLPDSITAKVFKLSLFLSTKNWKDINEVSSKACESQF